MNTQLYSTPIHVAAEDVNIENVRLLLENPKNKADVNSNNKLGLTAIHILLGKLVEFAAWQNKAKNIRPNKVDTRIFLTIEITFQRVRGALKKTGYLTTLINTAFTHTLHDLLMTRTVMTNYKAKAPIVKSPPCLYDDFMITS